MLYGQCSTAELEEVENELKSGLRISALFCEFPGNPLLRSPDLSRLRRLADQYGFIIVCDDRIGTFINANILPYVDVVCTSLTQMFSGGCNVMGGSVIINPHQNYYSEL